MQLCFFTLLFVFGLNDIFAFQIGRIEPNFPKIHGHKGNILDLQFNPFNTNIIASAGEDARIKVAKQYCGYISCNINKTVNTIINNTKNKILTLCKVIRGTPKSIICKLLSYRDSFPDSSQWPFILHIWKSTSKKTSQKWIKKQHTKLSHYINIKPTDIGYKYFVWIISTNTGIPLSGCTCNTLQNFEWFCVEQCEPSK